jgi:hypothetical protein
MDGNLEWLSTGGEGDLAPKNGGKCFWIYFVSYIQFKKAFNQ